MNRRSFALTMIAIVIAAVFVARVGAARYAFAADPANPLSDEELAALVKPAVVRVVQVDAGTSTIPAFDFDLNNFTLIPLPNARPYVIPTDATLLGSGFVVNPDGYILTNSHVVSERSIESAIADELISAVVLKDTLKLSATQLNNLEASMQSTATSSDATQALSEALSKKAEDYIYTNGTFDITRTLTVLNPSSSPSDINDLIAGGFPATLLSVDDNFANDEKDVALIKIDQQNLPSVSIGSSAGLAVGQPLSVIGFPATAQVGETDYLDADFTDGVVSAIKSSDDGTFNIVQTNAKISSGSSGSPLILSDGTVAGIITFESNLAADASADDNGDNFASAIPIELATSIMSANNVSNKTGSYETDLAAGLALLHENHCKAANAQFELAEATNQHFAPASYVAPFIAQCAAMIASGKSIDSSWDEAKLYLESIGWQTWLIVVGGLVVVLLLIFFIIQLLRRSRKEEGEIAKLESMISAPGAPPPGLVAYIKSEQKSGSKDEDIVSELEKAGWQAGEIAKAMEAATK